MGPSCGLRVERTGNSIGIHRLRSTPASLIELRVGKACSTRTARAHSSTSYAQDRWRGPVAVVVWPTPSFRPRTRANGRAEPAVFHTLSRIELSRAMDAWPRCLERLEAELPAEDVHTWLKPLQAEQRNDAV